MLYFGFSLFNLIVLICPIVFSLQSIWYFVVIIDLSGKILGVVVAAVKVVGSEHDIAV